MVSTALNHNYIEYMIAKKCLIDVNPIDRLFPELPARSSAEKENYCSLYTRYPCLENIRGDIENIQWRTNRHYII